VAGVKQWSLVIVFIACLAALRVASKQNEHRRSVVAEKTPCIRIGVRVHGAFSATAEHLVVCPLWGGKYLTLNFNSDPDPQRQGEIKEMLTVIAFINLYSCRFHSNLFDCWFTSCTTENAV